MLEKFDSLIFHSAPTHADLRLNNQYTGSNENVV